jgi:hypothetical protein
MGLLVCVIRLFLGKYRTLRENLNLISNTVWLFVLFLYYNKYRTLRENLSTKS